METSQDWFRLLSVKDLRKNMAIKRLDTNNIIIHYLEIRGDFSMLSDSTPRSLTRGGEKWL